MSEAAVDTSSPGEDGQGRKRKSYKLPLSQPNRSDNSSSGNDSSSSSDDDSLGSHVRKVVSKKIYDEQGRELKKLKTLYEDEKEAALVLSKEAKSWKTKFSAAERRANNAKSSLETTQKKLQQEKTKNQCLSDELESKKKTSRVDIDTARSKERLKMIERIGDAEAETVKQKGIAKDWKTKYEAMVKELKQVKKDHELTLKKQESEHKAEVKRLTKSNPTLLKKVDDKIEAKQLHERKKMELEIQKAQIDLEKTKTVKMNAAELKEREHRQKLEQIAARSTSSLLAYKEKTKHKKKAHQDNIKAMTERIREASAGHEASDGRFPGPSGGTISDAVQFLANQKKAQRLNSERIKEQDGEWHNIRYSASRYPSPPPPQSVARMPPPRAQAAHQTTLTQLWTPDNSSRRSRSSIESAHSSFKRLYNLPPGWNAVWDEPSSSTVFANITLGRIVRNLDDVFRMNAPDVMSSVSSQSARGMSIQTGTPRPDGVVSGVTPLTASTANKTSLDNPVELLSSEDEEVELEQAALTSKAIAEEEEESTVASVNLLQDSQEFQGYDMVETQHSYSTENPQEDDKENVDPDAFETREDAFETQAAVCHPKDIVYE